jgi:hypothetical protein
MAITDNNNSVAILEWSAWEGFLLNHVLGDFAVRIETDPFREFPSEQFDRICASCSTVCLQINLSVRGQLPLRTRDLTDRFVNRGLYVVNGVVQDIRKSNLQAHLRSIGLPSVTATPAGPADEVLFVKTDLNYGGQLERWLPQENATRFEHLISPTVGPYHYQTASRGVLPAATWTDPTLVVEKYITNPENSFYRVYFSGKQVIIVKAFSRGMIKKLSGDSRDTNYVTELEHLLAGTDELELSAALKQDVAKFIESAPIEFGSLDVVHDGQDNHYIIDLNLTPYAGTRPHDPFLIEVLRAGITDSSRRKPIQFVNSPIS